MHPGPTSKTSSKTHEVTSAPIDQREPLPIERGVQPKDEKDQDRKGSTLNVGVPCALDGQLCPRTQHSTTLSINTTQNHRKRSVFLESSSSYCRSRPEVGLAAPFSGRGGTLSARFGTSSNVSSATSWLLSVFNSICCGILQLRWMSPLPLYSTIVLVSHYGSEPTR